MITIMMVPLAVVIICYALFTFYMRSKSMERKQVCLLLMCSCTCRCKRYRQQRIVAQQHFLGEGCLLLRLEGVSAGWLLSRLDRRGNHCLLGDGNSCGNFGCCCP